MWKDKLEFWILLIIVIVSLLVFLIYRVVKKNLPSDLEEKMMTKSDDDKEKEVKCEEKSEAKSVVEKNPKNILGDTIPLANDSIVDSLGQSMDLKGGEGLWFNELVEM
jgi:FtsZ-interacting cell division protein ZipA